MSQVTRLVAAAALSAIVTVSAMLFLTRPASAQVGRTAVCTGTSTLTYSPKWEDAEWMNAQLKAGKTQFIQVGSAVICAW
jgi:hypothetical protein